VNVSATASGALTDQSRILGAIVGLALIVLVLELVRRRKLQERYIVLWVGAGIAIIIACAFPALINLLSDALGVRAAFAGMIALVFLLLFVFALHTTTVISRLSEQVTRLAQEVALAQVDNGSPADLSLSTREAAAPDVFRAFKDTAQWLNADDSETATAVGLEQTIPSSWRRDELRPPSSRRLFELHATLDALQRRLGDDGLQLWLDQESPTRRREILDGHMESIQPAVHEALFAASRDQHENLAWAPEVTAPSP
jgi:hypothetical protein